MDMGGNSHLSIGGRLSHVNAGGGRQSHVNKKLAADYYLGKARYSPASGKRRQVAVGPLGQQKVGFGSSAPRWPVKEESRSTLYGGGGSGDRQRDSGRLRAQPVSATRPSLPTYLPSFHLVGVAKEERGGVAREERSGGAGIWKRAAPPRRSEVVQREGDGGWSFPPVSRRPAVVPEATYHSSVSTTKRANIHGRTDWSAK